MRKLLLLFVCTVAFAQTPVNISFGGLSCAAIRRPEFKVQTYCYTFPPNPGWILVNNAISNLERGSIVTTSSGSLTLAGGIMVSYAPCKLLLIDPTSCIVLDSIVWHFVMLETGEVKFNVTMAHNGASIEDSGVKGIMLGSLP